MKTLEAQLRCAERELAIRRKVYPNRVKHGALRPEIAAHEQECMESIVHTLAALVGRSHNSQAVRPPTTTE